MFRKRLIPEECVELKEDKILYQDKEKIVTQWKTLKPREDFSYGYSCYYLKEGYKVSKFLKENGELKCWYCDIIKAEWKEERNGWIFTDLLADVIIKETGEVQVADLDEVAEAFEQEILSKEDLIWMLQCLNRLLSVIGAREFTKIIDEIEHIIKNTL